MGNTKFFIIFLVLLYNSFFGGKVFANECYQSFVYDSEAAVSIKKMNLNDNSVVEGIIHTRNLVVDNAVKESMYLFDPTKYNMTLSEEAESFRKKLNIPVKVIYDDNGVIKKILAYNGDKNSVLNGIVRDIFYPKREGYYDFILDDIKSSYQASINDKTIELKPLSIKDELNTIEVINASYQMKLNDECLIFDTIEASKDVVQEMALFKNKVEIKSKYRIQKDKKLNLAKDHWFLTLAFNDSAWSSPNIVINNTLSQKDAENKIGSLMDMLKKNMDNIDDFLEMIEDQDTWLVYLPDFLQAYPLDDAVSKMLFLALGRKNTPLTVDVLNRVAQAPLVNEDDRFRAVAALLTTDAPLSVEMLNKIGQVIYNNNFINTDISTQAYIMSLGAMAADRLDTAPGQTEKIRQYLVSNLRSSSSPTIAVINSVGNLKKAITRDGLLALESIVTSNRNITPHQKASTISSIARLGESTLSLYQMKDQLNRENDDVIKTEWLGVIGSTKSIDPTSAKNALLSIAEDNKVAIKVRSKAVLNVIKSRAAVLDANDMLKIRKLIPLIKDKETKKAIYKLLVK